MNPHSVKKNIKSRALRALVERLSVGMQKSRRADRATGFTLIEVLIVVAIIGIIAAIAYPSYGTFVQRTKRSDAHLGLLNAQQSMERCKATSYSYVGCSLPADHTSPEGYFEIELKPAPTATTYTISAKPTGTHKDPDCAAITIDEANDKSPAACWD